MAQYYGYDNRPSGGFLSSFFGNIPEVTRNLFFVNVLMFIATLINENFMFETFSVFYPKSPYFRIWQPVTYMFMHGNFWHLFVNMWCLLMFGSALERAIGGKKYLCSISSAVWEPFLSTSWSKTSRPGPSLARRHRSARPMSIFSGPRPSERPERYTDYKSAMPCSIPTLSGP